MKSNPASPNFNFHIYLPVLLLIISSLACSLSQPKPTPTRTPASKAIPAKIPTKTQKPTQTKSETNSDDLVRFWATTGEASSQFGSDGWSALQVGGVPNTSECGDHATAWASAESIGVDSVTAYFMEEPLIPSQINIVQSYNPSQVVKVELIDVYSEHSDVTVYKSEPKAVGQCPYTLSIPVTGIDYPIMGVRITVDQSKLGLGWNEIDAVELVGKVEAGIGSQSVPDTLPMPGLAGTWQDPESGDMFVIVWQNDQYILTSATWKSVSYSIDFQTWEAGSLTWAYYNPELKLTIQYTTKSISGDKLSVNWSYNNGEYGSETLVRVK